MRIVVLGVFLVLALVSAFYIPQLKFSFDFEQFFPQGDEDLAFFKEFIEEFETDDNFLLVAIRREEGVFDSVFLNQFHDFSLAVRQLPYVEKSQSLTQIAYPVKTPFAITTIPAIHLQQPDRYDNDRKKILADERFVYNLISEDATALVVFIKTVESIQLDQAKELMAALDKLVAEYDFEEHHYLGRAYFQKELVDMQKREVLVSAIVSGILVTIILLLIFRRLPGVMIALVSIGLGMLLFMGFLGISGRELNAMAALYPVLMIIVGTSDVIHIMSKYVDELRKGNTRWAAIRTTVREIGLATLLTSLTTAVGFATLFTSKVYPIRDFGINAAIGVLIAYVTVIGFSTYLLTFFKTDQIIKVGRGQVLWEKAMERTYQFTLNHPRGILLGAFIVLLLSGWGISRITTNYNIINNMPIGRKISEDFFYFERVLAGFRPMEFAVSAQPGYKATDFEVIKQMEKLEDHLHQYAAIRAIGSVTALYKSINQMMNSNRQDAYKVTDDPQIFDQQQKLAEKVPQLDAKILLSKDGEKARITSRINDIGADSIKNIGQRIDQWILNNTDSSIVKINRTGTGLIIDKNAEYVRESLIKGLGLAIIIVSLLMGLLFRNWKILLISLIPNIFPILLAGALLGFLGIELEAGVAIVFAVIFGIAVDDTIHFLSKYKLSRNKGYSVEESLHVTFLETGKAIVLTTVILFFGFLVMLFSIHPPSVTIGLLISLTLASALISDLLLIPVLIRRWMPMGGKE